MKYSISIWYFTRSPRDAISRKLKHLLREFTIAGYIFSVSKAVGLYTLISAKKEDSILKVFMIAIIAKINLTKDLCIKIIELYLKK